MSTATLQRPAEPGEGQSPDSERHPSGRFDPFVPGPQAHNAGCPPTLDAALRRAKRPRAPAAPPATRKDLRKLKRTLLAELRKLDALELGGR